MDHTLHFSEIGNAAYAFTTPGSEHTLLDMHAGSLQAGWLLPLGETWPVSRPHPLGNINQFYGVRSESEVLDLTWHEERRVMRNYAQVAFSSLWVCAQSRR